MANEKGTRGRRQTPGTGSVTTLPSGRHRWRFTTGKKTYSGTCDTEDEADRMRAAMVVERNDALKAGKAPRPAELTLAAWVDAPDGWIERREQQHLVRWSDKERDRWDRYLKGSTIASLPLRAIGRPDVVAWVGEMLLRTRTRLQPPQPLARQTINNALNLLRKALGDALEAGHLDANPATGVKVPKRVGVMPRPTPHLTIEEVRKVETTTAIPERARLVYVVAIFGGFRAGELVGLRVGDVHLDGDAPHVAVNWSHSNGPKSGRAGEEVPLLPQARDALRRVLELRAADVAPEKLPADAHVFPSATSQQRAEGDDFGWASQKKGKQKAYVGHRERIGVNPLCTLHCLRHTFGTLAVEGSLTGEPMSLHHVQRYLRHADPKTSLRYAKMGTAALYDATAPKAPAEAPPERVLGVSLEGGPAKDTLCVFIEPPKGFEPSTYGLRNRGGSAENKPESLGVSLSCPCDAATTELAISLLRAVDEGTPTREPARALAIAVLKLASPDSQAWARAVAVLEGGPMRARHAVDLAGDVVDAAGGSAGDTSFSDGAPHVRATGDQ